MSNKTMINRLRQYFHIWLQYGKISLQLSFINRFTLVFFFVGKVVRYGMTLLLLWLLRANVAGVGPYSVDQMIVFFLVYQTIDTLSQMAYRGVYEFGNKIRSGEFDFDLLKPINPLFRSLLGNPDINDVLFAVPTILLNIYIISNLHLSIELTNIGLFLLLLINGFVIATAFHMLVLATAIFVVDVDNIVWFYRDISRLGQIPVGLHLEFVRFILLFIIPVAAMMTVPAQALLGLTPSLAIWTTLLIGALSIGISYLLWKWALKKYTGASS